MLTTPMARTTKTAQDVAPGVAQVLKRLHCPLDVSLMCVWWSARGYGACRRLPGNGWTGTRLMFARRSAKLGIDRAPGEVYRVADCGRYAEQ
ncbi:hypothetical protein OKW45_004235 [Paraburkholderia sp. WSM4175]